MSYYIHSLDPIALRLGDFWLPWYWLVYIFGFFYVYWASLRLIRGHKLDFSKNNLIDLLLISWLSMIVGARLFYILFYNLSYFVENPSEAWQIWNGGMSFHGGLIGGVIGLAIACRLKKKSFIRLCDVFAVSVPLVLGFGRIANFINGELAGRPSTLPWAVVFPKFYDQIPRHPSQLYQALLEGFLLFLILMSQRDQLKTPSRLSAMFLVLYGSLRFMAEFFRNPDPQISFIFTHFTMGQILCFGMILAGIALHLYYKKFQRT